jgi:biotin operon repressor
MTQLAEELNDSRLNISIALNSMQDDGLIILSRGMITIPKLEKVILATK